MSYLRSVPADIHSMTDFLNKMSNCEDDAPPPEDDMRKKVQKGLEVNAGHHSIKPFLSIRCTT